MSEREKSERWQKRRSEILQIAERLFAEKGFTATRLEDVAEAIGIRRASLVYYFRDKRELYEAILEGIYLETLQVVEATRALPTPIERVQTIASEWMSLLAERPSIALLLLREITDGETSPGPTSVKLLKEILDAFQDVMNEGKKRGTFEPVDAIHYSMIMAGTSLFMMAAQPVLKEIWDFDPLAPENIALQKKTLDRIGREILSSTVLGLE